MDFINRIKKQAKDDIKTIVLPESSDIRILQAAAIIQKQEIANVILIGEETEIRKFAGDLDISRVKVISPPFDNKFSEYVYSYYELRKSKGIDLETASKIMRNPLYYATMMVKNGEADGMVAGAVNSTADTLRPALQILKTAKDVKLVSSFFVMVVPNCEYGYEGVFVYADCGLVMNPTDEELAEIAISSAKSFEALIQEEPIIAMLSYSTYGSAKSEFTGKIVRATRIVRNKTPNLKIDGELQADAAIIPEVGRQKAPDSWIAGNANVLIFPDLNSGNIAYKLTQRLAKADAYGPITQGLAKPVNDLSRGCSTEDIVGVVAITCVQAQYKLF